MPAARVQGLPVKVPEPAGVAVKVTVPVGVLGVAEVSLTLAIQDETAPKTREEEAQETVVTVEELIEGTVEGELFAETKPTRNGAGEEFATVDPRPGTVASDGMARNNTKEMPTAKMRNASVVTVFLEVRLNGRPKLRPTALRVVPPFGISETPPIKRISSPVLSFLIST